MIDTHVHLYSEKYIDHSEIIREAFENGITSMVNIGCDLESIDPTIRISNEYENIYCAIGIHPINYLEYDSKVEEKLTTLVKSEKKVKAVGEIGLDYHWYPNKKNEQAKIFIQQLDLAKSLDVPVIIHCREALDDLYDILAKYKNMTIIIHSFSGNALYAKKFLELGVFFGFSGPITFKNGQNQREACGVIPLDRILLETDGPYLTPEPFRGKLNKPHYTIYVAEMIAQIKDVPVDKVIRETTNTAERIFKINV